VIILRSCVDTLEHTFSGQVSEAVVAQLDALKEFAQDKECPQPILLAGCELFVQPQSVVRYRWLIRNSSYLLMLRRGGVGPCMIAKLTSRGLVERGLETLWDEVLAITRKLGLLPLNVSRLDLAVDFQGWKPTFDEMRNVRCRSTYRPVLPNVDNPQTFYFGKAPKMVRVYDKTTEIAVKGNEWWRTVWRSTGNYREDLPVWRIELELRSEVLKERSCRSMEVALERLASIFSWGLCEVSLGEPNGDSNRARWPEDERWRLLRESFGIPEPLSRVRPFIRLLDYDKALQRYMGVASSLAASLGLENYEAVGRILFDGGEIYLDAKGITFGDLVETKRRRVSE
jgi:hypothetical protein